jgi:two-component system, OmpR family, phosphate regulon sensor histidine kinase PhoR
MTDTRPEGELRKPDNPARRDLQRNSDFLAALLAMAGHDLRQPLQVIMGAHARLAHRLTTGREHEYVVRGQRGVAQLRDQLDLLVHALRLYEYAGAVRAAPIPLRPRLANLADDHTPSARQKGVDLRIVLADRVIMSDVLLLDGILRNLVRNALKYTRASGQILVGCRRRGPALRIEVHDTGIGISPDNLARIFGAFQRVGSVPSEGLGLGLFIVKHAADALGHRIEVASTLGRGSCFSVLVDTAFG